MLRYYPEEIIDEIRISNDIVDVVSEYVRLEKKGKDYFGLCPLHREKTPSFSVAPLKQIFYCFGCGKGGNVINFIMNVENLDYTEALKYLAERARIQLPEGDNSEEIEKAKLKRDITEINKTAARYFYAQLTGTYGKSGLEYLKGRGLTEKTIKHFGIGYCGGNRGALYSYLRENGYQKDVIFKSGLFVQSKNGDYYERFRERIIFPIFDIRGNVIGFGGRVTDKSVPKYINSPETPVYTKSKALYGLNFAKKSGEKKILIVEGYMDVISLHQSGIINTVASLGTALTESQGRLLKKYADEVIIAYDADTAGQAAAMRGLDLLGDAGCNVKVLIIPEGKDPDEFVRKNGADEFRKLIKNSVSLIEYKIRDLKRKIDSESTEGKIEFLNKTAEILARVANDVEREMYVKKLAEEYKITEAALFSEVYKRVRSETTMRIYPGNAAKAGIVKSSANKAGTLYKDWTQYRDNASGQDPVLAQDRIPVQDRTPAHDRVLAQDRTPVQDRVLAQDGTNAHDRVLAQDGTKAQEMAPAQNRGSKSTYGDAGGDKLAYFERMLLTFLCADNNLHSIVESKMQPSDFSTVENRNMAALIYDRLINKRGFAIAELCDISDTEDASDFARIFQKECNCEDNCKAIMDIIKKIGSIRQEKRRKEILELLKDEIHLSEGDALKLKMELNSIMKCSRI